MRLEMTEQRCDATKIQVGDRLSELQYYEVLNVGNSMIKVRNDRGEEFTISTDIIEEGSYSANQYGKETKVTRTELIEVLNNVGDSIFTVCFDKQNGEERTLVGYKIPSPNGYGRTSCIDVELDASSHRVRQIDHRSLKWLIYKNVKFVVK